MWSDLSVRTLSVPRAFYTRFHNLLGCLITFLLMWHFSAERSWNDEAVNGNTLFFPTPLDCFSKVWCTCIVPVFSAVWRTSLIWLSYKHNFFLRPNNALPCHMLSLWGLWLTWLFGKGPKLFFLFHPGITNNVLTCFHTAGLRPLTRSTVSHQLLLSCNRVVSKRKRLSGRTCYCRAPWCHKPSLFLSEDKQEACGYGMGEISLTT